MGLVLSSQDGVHGEALANGAGGRVVSCDRPWVPAVHRDDRDRAHFLELLEEMVTVYRVRPHAYVLMGNHYHLLLELTEANLSRAIQWLQVSYNLWFNRRHGRCGHLFQGRFKSLLVQPETWGLPLSRFVHVNPVRVAGRRLGKRE